MSLVGKGDGQGPCSEAEVLVDTYGPYFYCGRVGISGSSPGLSPVGFPVGSCENHCFRLCWHGHTMAAVTSLVISDLVQEHFELKPRSFCSLSWKESFCSQKRNTFIKLFCRLDSWGGFTVLLKIVVAPVLVGWSFDGVRQSESAYPDVNMGIRKVNAHLVDFTLLVNPEWTYIRSRLQNISLPI